MKYIFVFFIFFTISFAQDIEDDMLEDFNDIKIEQKQQNDPFKSYNIFMTNFNDKVYHNIWKPVATTYKNSVNEEVRNSIDNMFLNLLYPISFVNNILQLKLKNALIETGRFIINSTLGIFGLFDVAKNGFGLEPKREDFGQTLGYWGVGSGPHIVLPFFGPSNLRDLVSFYPDALLNPVVYDDNSKYHIPNTPAQSAGLIIYDKLNKTSLNINLYDNITDGALSKYQILKTTYEQKRAKEIKE